MAGGLAELEQAHLDLAAAALTACGRPVPDATKRIRYHGDIAVQSCCDHGLLTCHWNPVTIDRTGIPAGVTKPPGRPSADVCLRLYRCFPTLNDDGTFDDAKADSAAAGLALDLDCITTALLTAICAGTLAEHLAGCAGLELLGATPRKPAGGCAGIEWKVRAQWRAWSAS